MSIPLTLRPCWKALTLAMGLCLPLLVLGKEGKGGVEGMLDARVNAPQAAEQALAARVGEVSSVRPKAQRDLGALREAARALAVRKPGVEVSWSPLTGGPSTVYARAGVLAEAKDTHEATVRGYLREERGVYGLSTEDLTDLQVLGVSDGGELGLPLVRLEQQVQGRAVFGSETRFVLDRDGRLVKTLGDLVPNARGSVPKVKAGVKLSASEAIVDVLASLGHLAHPQAFTQTGEHNGWLELSETDEFVAGTVSAKEVWFPLSAGVLVPAWSVLARTTGTQDYYAVVDGETGAILWRKEMRQYFSNHDARFRVYVQADGTTPADSPAPMPSNMLTPPPAGWQAPAITPTIVSMHSVMNQFRLPNGTFISQDGWLNDCDASSCPTTWGNNASICLDRTGGADANICDTDAANQLDGNGTASGNPDNNGRFRNFFGTSPRDFETAFLPPPQNGDPEIGTSASAKFPSFDRGVLTHAFYVANWWHDRMYQLGFDEGAGNFQFINFTGQGRGGDYIEVFVQSSGVDHSDFSSTPDGARPRLRLSINPVPNVDRDDGLDTQVLVHELTHGLSTRLIGNNSTGLSWSPGWALGEGWSDFYALALLNNTQSNLLHGFYTKDPYSAYKLQPGFVDNYIYGTRRFPYTTNNSINPLTWADVDDVTFNASGGIPSSSLVYGTPGTLSNYGAMEVHNAGELWTLSLWEVRERVINDPMGAKGNVALGNETMLRMVTQAMKMTPTNPTFIEARDALFEADCVLNACANEASIWAGFADRGLGYGAAAPYAYMTARVAPHLGIHESVVSAQLDVVNPLTDVVIDDGAGNKNGAIDPGEPVQLRIGLTNPWRGQSAFGVTATLETTTPGVTILDNMAKYSAIKPCEKDPSDMNHCKTQKADNGDGFVIKVEPWIPCGSNLHFRLRTQPHSLTGLQGEMLTTFDLRLGQRTGPGTPYWTGVANLNAAIPDGTDFKGVVTNLLVLEDNEIADLNFRVDSITHPFVGDLRVMLRSPQGIGNDLITHIGKYDPSTGWFANITNMVIDDDLPYGKVNSMLVASPADAPLSRSWLPVYNANFALSYTDVPFDGVGSLSRYQGTSTQGLWSVVVSDEWKNDAGTLNGWSLGITPMQFACTPFTGPQVNLQAQLMTDAKLYPLGAGTTFHYVVLLSNLGTGTQANNPGDEFSLSLPPTLTLVKAAATQGVATTSAATRTVTWNGSVGPGASVVLAIEAKIPPSVPVGTSISTQGAVSYDNNADGVNESNRLTDDPYVVGIDNPTVFSTTDKLFGTGFE